MLPLTADDLLSLEEYASRRRELFDSHRRYLDRYRRVRIGPRLTLVFENRQTLWFRVQEIIRIARLTDSRLIQLTLDLYHQLLPQPHQLQAALLLEVPEEHRWLQELASWQHLQGQQLRMHAGDQQYPAQLLTSRPEDRCAGTAHWVQFRLDPQGRALLGDCRQPVFFAVTADHYQHQSGLLGDDVRQSLLDDLNLSDRDMLAKAG